jgi:hypothetical protein
MITSAATLNAHGIPIIIETFSQAAEALRLIAGDFAYLIFALGIIGTGYRCLQLGDLRNRRAPVGLMALCVVGIGVIPSSRPWSVRF